MSYYYIIVVIIVVFLIIVIITTIIIIITIEDIDINPVIFTRTTVTLFSPMGFQVTNPPAASDFADDAARLEFAQRKKEQAMTCVH